MKDYDHKEIEGKWQKRWAEQKLYDTPDTVAGKENFYALVEFPYPSGDLHVGHWYAFAVPDIFARMKRMQGSNVLYPIGFDAFGLPAENAAIKRNISPAEWIEESVRKMTLQLQSMGNSFDWTRTVVTSDPAYYKWTQWLFLQFYNKGLVYRGKGLVNWCPNDQTVLANEQVIDGKCERCGAEVVEKELEQWFFKIRDYADRLVADLEPLNWPESIKEAQRNWIGRSEGAEIDFQIAGSDQKITVFTTRADTLFGATFLVVAPEHPLVSEYANAEVKKYVEKAKNKTEIERTGAKEKTGIELKGVKAINPGTKEEIPIYVADYVLATYGTGAIMAVPAHDARDHAFAEKFGVPLKQVVAPYAYVTGQDAARSDNDIVYFDAGTAILKHWSEDKYYIVEFAGGIHGNVGGHIEAGETSEETARREVTEESGYTDIKSIRPLFEHAYSRGYKTRKSREEECHDAIYVVELASGARQEIVDTHTKKGSWMSREEILSLKTLLDHHKIFFDHYFSNKVFEGDGKLVNSGPFDGLMSEEAKQKITEAVGGRIKTQYKVRDWLISRQRYWGAPIPVVYDPEGKPHPIPDEHLPWLLPTDADIKPRGTSPLGSSKELKDRVEKVFGKGWTPETDTMDGFVDNSWYFFRYLDSKNDAEFSSKEKQKTWMPVKRYSGGAEHTTVHVLYSRFFVKALNDMGLTTVSEPYEVRLNRGIILAEDGRKMSKRWGNVVNPDEQVANVGADSVRTYLAFIGPYNEIGAFPWNTNGLVGVRRFLERVYALGSQVKDLGVTDTPIVHQTIHKVTESIEAMKFNTGVSQLMIFFNHIQSFNIPPKDLYEILLKLLAPFAPHMTEELWRHELGHEGSIHQEVWPIYDPAKTMTELVTVAIQVGGKTRGVITVPRGAPEEEVMRVAREDAKIVKYLDFKPSKLIFVIDKILNLVP